MNLRLKNLQRVVSRVYDEEKAFDALRVEVKRVLGPIMDTDVKLDRLAETVNDRVNVLEMTGRTVHLGFKPSVVARYMDHVNPEVRTMAANLLPSNFLDKMKSDPHSSVRAAVARRLDVSVVKEMMRKFPSDDMLKNIYRKKHKQLNEDGIPTPKNVDEPFDMYGEGPLGDAGKQAQIPELSDAWYEEKAFKLIQDYGTGIDYNWEELAVHRFCASSKATSGVEIDEERLLKAVFDQIEEREDRVLERDALKELASMLRSNDSLISESYEETVDPVAALVSENLSPSAFIEKASKLFNVQESRLPVGLKKHCLGIDSTKIEQTIPMKAKVPSRGGIRAIDEQALDRFVECWNSRQERRGEPVKIEWNVHPSEEGVVGFRAVLR
jgi:hypothetical protein